MDWGSILQESYTTIVTHNLHTSSVPTWIGLPDLKLGHIYTYRQSALFLAKKYPLGDYAGDLRKGDTAMVVTKPELITLTKTLYTAQYWVVRVLTSTQILGWIVAREHRVGEMMFDKVT
jgi:hypothetical protein